MFTILSLLFQVTMQFKFFSQQVSMVNRQSCMKYQSLKSQLLRAWKLGHTTFTWCPKYDTYAYMTTLFWGNAHEGLCGPPPAIRRATWRKGIGRRIGGLWRGVADPHKPPASYPAKSQPQSSQDAGELTSYKSRRTHCSSLYKVFLHLWLCPRISPIIGLHRAASSLEAARKLWLVNSPERER